MNDTGGDTVMQISPDQWILAEWHGLQLTATVAFTWLVMALLAAGSWLVTSRLSTGEKVSRWQVMLEVIVTAIRDQISEISGGDGARYLPFIGTLFLFIAAANLLSVVPGYVPPTGSLSTTAALAIAVLVAVPAFSIARQGIGGYLKTYVRPSPIMLPFNLVSEASRTVALAVRLYGNVMSGTIIVGILISVAPFFFPVVMQVLGLLTGLIQAYIFAVLAMVYIASGARSSRSPSSDADASPANQTGHSQTRKEP
ncbi:F0F1 ATP synthase subunit A [Phaeobacter gallaeciensis]|uniref:F0F1 ATP synthase subunit A n=2 Tax=Phaeobacter gallaeciensis TaxID=60890 RepID=UPI00237F2778|nr:F0F1 ATP synthase subunit A [Phaeobacter gallaeciensis]MDE4106732.1 F0F1 ATP synthase subunit A [Phaeobacter gallaeciensis]